MNNCTVNLNTGCQAKRQTLWVTCEPENIWIFKNKTKQSMRFPIGDSDRHLTVSLTVPSLAILLSCSPMFGLI